MENKLDSLNNLLFEQIEALRKPELSGKELEEAINVANTVAKVAKTIVDSGNLSLKYMQHCAYYGIESEPEAPEIFKK